MKKILFTISSLGLGHATRTLSIINDLKEDNFITIVSYGNALNFLEAEFSEENNIEFISMEDYPKFGRGKGIAVYFNLIIDFIKTNFLIKKEAAYVKTIEGEYDFIFSDGRYGFNSKKIPSFLLSHQISLILPKYLSFLQSLVDWINYRYIKKFDKLFIPDFFQEKDSLAGELSHTRSLKNLNHEFIGILSSYKKDNLKCDIDYLFIISGYLRDNKNSFISNLIEESKLLGGKKVFILGDMTSNEIKEMDEFNIKIYPSVTGKLRNELFNRSKVIVSRSGYTTIMDLAELEKNAILFPTPNQEEQEYLARSNKLNDHFVIENSNKKINLNTLVNKIVKTKKIINNKKTVDSLRTIRRSIDPYIKKNFFSIVIPAHNEEAFLEDTMRNLSKLNYSTEDFEIILIENGSCDRTYKIALKCKEYISNLKVYQSETGVSIAKNLGKNLVSERSDWTIFLDADSIIEPPFLRELNNYLNKNENKDFTVGTCSILPWDSDSFYSKLWFKIYDVCHSVSNTSYSIQIAKTNFSREVDYDEELHYSEDLKFIRDMKKYGEFFFFKTKDVYTSTRRFEKYGYLTLTCLWILQSVLPKKIKRNKKYKVVRNL
ncbi:glycosyltransferase [Fusobacteria bacterium ZRK30]|nr:glycosyltransferase [Fusobacteria bacterium ZRK30]